MNEIRWKWRILDGLLLGGVLLLAVCLCVEPFRKEEGWGFFERILFKSKFPRKSIDISSFIMKQTQIPSFLRNFPQIITQTSPDQSSHGEGPFYLAITATNHFKHARGVDGTYFYTLQGERPFGEFTFSSMRQEESMIQLIRPIYSTQKPKISSEDKSCWVYTFMDTK